MCARQQQPSRSVRLRRNPLRPNPNRHLLKDRSLGRSRPAVIPLSWDARSVPERRFKRVMHPHPSLLQLNCLPPARRSVKPLRNAVHPAREASMTAAALPARRDADRSRASADLTRIRTMIRGRGGHSLLASRRMLRRQTSLRTYWARARQGASSRTEAPTGAALASGRISPEPIADLPARKSHAT